MASLQSLLWLCCSWSPWRAFLRLSWQTATSSSGFATTQSRQVERLGQLYVPDRMSTELRYCCGENHTVQRYSVPEFQLSPASANTTSISFTNGLVNRQKQVSEALRSLTGTHRIVSCQRGLVLVLAFVTVVSSPFRFASVSTENRIYSTAKHQTLAIMFCFIST